MKPIGHTHRVSKDGTVKVVKTNTKQSLASKVVNSLIDKTKGK